ncbi:MAG: electron transport complex subunit RsxC [Candidatus Cloacimonadales bacterium]|jgi:electron transport complex protein RnfC|nr:electron transport complex subunit RsxC [Candidatus Cloacimonadota bacterium]MDD3502266.1 electron transport complex subunit RsxC [Candidatus Cloacimonadota bacterium]MDX9977833.1 electron transport complex subunit RsxC [Candidatus Cloacimonadales bacterium]
MKFKSFNGGVHPKDSKEYSKSSAIEVMDIPKKVVIPLSQHIGAPANPIVKPGDRVKTGQLIAEPSAFVSLAMHSSVTGKVTKIAMNPHPGGFSSMAIEIETEEQDEWVELIDDANYLDLSAEEIKLRIGNAGICGMGGAGFPTLIKLSPPADKPIDTVILNGVECEPYLTSDYRNMLERPKDIIAGLKIIMKTLSAKQGYIGIEANKLDAIKLMTDLTKNDKDIYVVPLKLKYPQGAEKQLIYACTKRKVPNKGGLPSSVEVVVQNVGTAIAIYEAVRYKKPLIERVITVSGRIVKNPKNIQARVGTAFSELVEKCGGTTEEIGKIISGGPMMGFALPDLDAPVCKTSSGLLLFNQKEARSLEEHACLRCGRCVDACPLNLLPSFIASAVKYKDWDMAEKSGVMDCMKCGSCSYVCPAHIKIIQWVDIGKNQITAMRRTAKS